MMQNWVGLENTFSTHSCFFSFAEINSSNFRQFQTQPAFLAGIYIYIYILFLYYFVFIFYLELLYIIVHISMYIIRLMFKFLVFWSFLSVAAQASGVLLAATGWSLYALALPSIWRAFSGNRLKPICPSIAKHQACF